MWFMTGRLGLWLTGSARQAFQSDILRGLGLAGLGHPEKNDELSDFKLGTYETR